MREVILTINGQRIMAVEGMTILQAARSAGIEIPTLCDYSRLSSAGACRLCTVEVTKNGRSRLVVSCVYQVEDGLEVQTESERVAKGRKVILELLLARAPGVQKLREYGARYGVDLDRFPPEPNYCILCGLCVRYCAEVKRKDAIGFVGRGTERAVMFQPDIAAQECATCGECFAICPTGVLPSNYGLTRVPHFSWPRNPFAADQSKAGEG
jgi:bidirectional [NiFe] hydrogenase diaphorase subunit